jgi:hypothetical protein
MMQVQPDCHSHSLVRYIPWIGQILCPMLLKTKIRACTLTLLILKWFAISEETKTSLRVRLY